MTVAVNNGGRTLQKDHFHHTNFSSIDLQQRFKLI